MNKINPYTNSIFLDKQGQLNNHICCAFFYDEFHYESMLIPKEFFDNKDISLERLQKFVETIVSLFSNKYSYKYKIEINNNDFSIAEGSNSALYINQELINKNITADFMFTAYDTRRKSTQLILNDVSIPQLINYEEAKKILINEYEIKNLYLAAFSNNFLRIYRNYPELILNQELKTFFYNHINNKYSISSSPIISNVKTKDRIFEKRDFYEIKLSAEAFGIDCEPEDEPGDLISLRFILFNLLRIYQLGYNINIIKLFNVLQSKHSKEVNELGKALYFLFNAQGIERELRRNLSINSKTADYNEDFCILAPYTDDGVYEMNDYELHEFDGRESGVDDSLIGSGYKSLNIETIKAIYEDLQINYTKKLLNLFQWS